MWTQAANVDAGVLLFTDVWRNQQRPQICTSKWPMLQFTLSEGSVLIQTNLLTYPDLESQFHVPLKWLRKMTTWYFYTFHDILALHIPCHTFMRLLPWLRWGSAIEECCFHGDQLIGGSFQGSRTHQRAPWWWWLGHSPNILIWSMLSFLETLPLFLLLWNASSCHASEVNLGAGLNWGTFMVFWKNVFFLDMFVLFF